MPIQYPMLNNTNYGLWAVKMRTILRSLGVWAAIEGDALVEGERDSRCCDDGHHRKANGKGSMGSHQGDARW